MQVHKLIPSIPTDVLFCIQITAAVPEFRKIFWRSTMLVG